MVEFKIGDVVVALSKEALILRPRSSPDVEVMFDHDGVGELMELLRSSSGQPLNQRQGFRVPIHSPHPLETTLRIGTETFSVAARNVSLTGIFVEFQPNEFPDLPIDCDVAVVMEFEGERVTTPGIVRRREANGYGIFFVESIQGEELNPPQNLVRLVTKLRRAWLSAKLTWRPDGDRISPPTLAPAHDEPDIPA